jgi:hypothetical protein
MKKYSALAFIGLLFGLWGLITLVPPNMDEFIKYHRLACWAFEGSQYSVFQEGCDKYSASIFGIPFHRNYQYIGVLSNYLYAPFYYLIPGIYSHYLFGLVSLLLFSFLLVRALKVRWECIFIPLTFFPLLYLMIHDHGPANFSLISYPIFFLLVQKLFSRHLGLKSFLFLALGIAATVLVGLDEKVFYLYLIPQILILSFAIALYQEAGVLKKSDIIESIPLIIRRVFFLGLVILLVCAGFLFFIKTEGVNYFRYLVELKKIQSREAPIAFGDIYSFLIQFISIPYSYPHRIFHLNEGYLRISQIVFAPLLAIATYTVWHFKNLAAVWVLLLSEIILILTFFVTKNVWASHHFIFLQIPVIILLIFFANVSEKKFLLVSGFLLINLVTNMYLLKNSAVQGHARLSQSGIFEYLSQNEIAKNSLINFSSFGGYFILSLYGNKEQVVTWKDIKNTASGSELISLSKNASKKNILNACEGCDLELMKTAFPGSQIQLVGPKDATWRVWQIIPN